jgi:arginine/lysine/ornithine decarboxylase
VTSRVDHERAPIFETLTNYARGGIYGFHTPGHKGGRFAAAEVTELVGRSGLALDLPAMTATDNTFHPTGCVREAQVLAADLFGAGSTFFLTAGSTLGVVTSLLAAVPPGGTVVLPRNVHRSVVAGLVLSGAVPRFARHDVLSQWRRHWIQSLSRRPCCSRGRVTMVWHATSKTWPTCVMRVACL